MKKKYNVISNDHGFISVISDCELKENCAVKSSVPDGL